MKSDARPFPKPVLALVLGLAVTSAAAPAAQPNPPAPGFDLERSDPEAIEIADRVMEAMGGREAWDATRYLTWNFFGRRLHFWDKHSGDIRVEGTSRDDGQPYTILMNLHSKRGRAWRSGEEVTDAEALAELLDLGEAAWINDSYWMFMPYKLKDSGVTLGYLGEGSMQDGRAADVLQLTFAEVGRTPENKYHVYVGRDSGLVEQWDFYRNASDPEPGFRTPWHDWRGFGGILLSDNRGENRHTGIAVFDELPRSVFDDPAPVDRESLP